MSYFWVALGSALGGVARYGCTGLAARLFGASFPWGTLIVNVSGSLLIGVLAALLAPDNRLFGHADARAFLAVGVLGGFTTFSSFSLETLNLARNGEWQAAVANALASLLLCLTAVWFGHLLGSALQR